MKLHPRALVTALLSATSGALVLLSLTGPLQNIPWFAVVFFSIGWFLSAFAVLIPRLGAQVFVRSFWWSQFALGVFLMVLASGHDTMAGAVIIGLASLPLLSADRRALGEATLRSALNSTPHTASLQALSITSLAISQLLCVMVFFSFERSRTLAALLALVATALITATVSLLRLSPRGCYLSVASALSLYALAWQHVVHLRRGMTELLLVLATVQLTLTIALFFERPFRAPSPRAQTVMVNTVVVFTSLASLAYSFTYRAW